MQINSKLAIVIIPASYLFMETRSMKNKPSTKTETIIQKKRTTKPNIETKPIIKPNIETKPNTKPITKPITQTDPIIETNPIKKTKPIHKQNMLLVLRGRPATHFEQTVIVDFQPLQYFHNGTSTWTSPMPIFRNDRKYYTSSFADPFQPFDDSRQLQLYHQRIKIYQQKSSFAQAEPIGRKKCSVCKKEINNYFTHIESRHHIRANKRHPYQIKIKKFVRKFRMIYPEGIRDGRENEGSSSHSLIIEDV